jgi:hypothetical protein
LDFPAKAFIVFTSALQLGFTIWTVALAVIGVSEVQKLSVGKAFLNLILAIMIIIFPTVAIEILLSLEL